MAPAALQELVAASYVRDISRSRAFYELLGFAEQRSGTAPTSAWSALGSDGYMLLLVSTRPPLPVPALPLLFDFFFADLEVVIRRLAAAGVQYEHRGHPEHALGGEVRVSDPDGNTVLLSQRAAAAPGGTPAATAAAPFSLLREAAAAVAAQDLETVRCEAAGPGRVPCPETAEVKLADSGGDAAWVCLTHAEEILISVPAAFIASLDDRGIAAFLARPAVPGSDGSHR